MVEVIWLAIALPAAGAVLLHFFGRRLGEPWSGWLASAMVVGAFGVALAASVDFFLGDGEPETVFLFDWIPAVGARASLLWDPLAVIMTLVVTGVGSLIHVYSIGYMHGDPRFPRYFTYINFFVAAMLTLVLADNFALLFVGWEGVGLASYLLISFWYRRPVAAAAGKKAFIVNRVGDAFFLIGLMIIFTSFGALSYAEVLTEPQAIIGTGTATAITLMLVLGAAGKSAQIPLYFWLPDAMEGPTPVSALIHAATMVTAGVYVVARTASLFEMSTFTAGLVATVGAVTALWAASIALMQRDIKRVLAYSTISQLGYMFLAVGVGAYVSGIFHLYTHAFFKALLFMTAGAVIHAMADRQDLADMGGLRRYMPITAGTALVGTAAIAGIPPLAGFWSKDEILALTYQEGGLFYILYGIGLFTALLTAVYMTRWFLLAFLGERRWDADEVHPHEAPPTMALPLVLLAIASVGAGLINTPFRLGLEHFLEPAFEQFGVELVEAPEGSTAAVLIGASVLVAVAGIAYGWLRYRDRAGAYDLAPVFSRRVGFWRWVRNGYYVDSIIGNVIVAPAKLVAAWLAFVFDKEVVDGAVNGAGGLMRRVAAWLRPLQTGFVRNYGVALLAGVVGLLIWFVSQGVGT